MFTPDEAETSIIIVACNSADVLRECLSSVAQHTTPSAEVIVVDNASQDESASIARQTFPNARIFRLDRNRGFGAGCNVGAAAASGRYFVFLNPDTVVEPGWLPPLIQALESDNTIGAVTSKIVLLDDPSRINACGNDVHFTGFPSCRLLGGESGKVQQPANVTSVSGAAFAIRRTIFERLGGFDEGFFLYLEDNDLSWQLWLMGHRCVYVPASVVRHRYRVSVSAPKFYHLEHNRHQLLAKNLQTRTLLALLPALALAECSTWGYAILRGPDYFKAKFRATIETLSKWRSWRRAHAGRARARTQPDTALLVICAAQIDYATFAQGRLADLAAVVTNPLYRMIMKLALLALSIRITESSPASVRKANSDQSV